MKCLPERGRIGIFNRSYDEETRLAGRLALPITGHKVISHGRAKLLLVVRVHPELLAKQRIPEQLITKDIWEERYHDIRHFERYLTRNGVVIRKFFCTSPQRNRRNASLSGSIIR
jgi:polyphosphate kinase 2 (PPK2 family)